MCKCWTWARGIIAWSAFCWSLHVNWFSCSLAATTPNMICKSRAAESSTKKSLNAMNSLYYAWGAERIHLKPHQVGHTSSCRHSLVKSNSCTVLWIPRAPNGLQYKYSSTWIIWNDICQALYSQLFCNISNCCEHHSNTQGFVARTAGCISVTTIKLNVSQQTAQ